jgi:hypothetical protein
LGDEMKTSFPGFTVLVERVLRVTCLLGVAALAACGGGSDEHGDQATDGATQAPSMSAAVSAPKPRTVAPPPTTDARRTHGVVLSEKVSAPEGEDDDERADAS